MRQGERDGDARALADRAFDVEPSGKALDAFANALKPEMSLLDAGRGGGVEARAVVVDGKEQLVAVEAAGDADRGGVAVTDGVDGRQLALERLRW